jgi:L-threonylcarbamoyladenylate synthase
MSAQNTRVMPYDGAAIAEAARLIGDGLPVAVPTETVYGLAADAGSGEAVARIYEAKGRPSFNPLIVHVRDFAQASEIAVFDDAAHALAERYWPGPLTLVLPLREGAPVASLVTAGMPTVALRMPAHPAMRDLLTAVGRPLAAPSANASGRISPTRAAHVLASLDGRIPLIVDAGPTELGLESTIVAVTGGHLRLLRPGPIAWNEITSRHSRESGNPAFLDHAGEERLGPRFRGGDGKEGMRIEAPGQLASHYAPARPLRLDAVEARPGEWLIGFGGISGDASLSPSGDLVEAASRLFAALHEADASGRAAIAVAPIPAKGLGLAINDRLRRAAAPR